MPAYVRDDTKRYVEFKRTYTADTPRGTVELLNDIYGFNHVTMDISERADGTFIYRCPTVVIGKKTGTGEEILAGEYVYGDPNDNYDVSATKGAGYIYLGIAQVDATASATTIDIEFDGTMADLR